MNSRMDRRSRQRGVGGHAEASAKRAPCPPALTGGGKSPTVNSRLVHSYLETGT